MGIRSWIKARSVNGRKREIQVVGRSSGNEEKGSCLFELDCVVVVARERKRERERGLHQRFVR